MREQNHNKTHRGRITPCYESQLGKTIAAEVWRCKFLPLDVSTVNNLNQTEQSSELVAVAVVSVVDVVHLLEF